MSEINKNSFSKNSKSSGKHKEEIDLLDLFLVLVKYRKMIIILTFTALCVSVIGYYVYPQYQYSQAQEKKITEVRLKAAASAALKAQNFNYNREETESAEFIALKSDLNLNDDGSAEFKSQNADYNLQEIYTRPNLLLQAFLDAGFTEYTFYNGVKADFKDEKSYPRTLFLIQQRLIDNKSLDGKIFQDNKRILTVRNTETGVLLMFSNHDADRAKAFVESLYKLGYEALEQELKDELEAAISAYEQLLEIENPGENLAQQIVSGQRRYDQAKKILAGEKKLLTRIGNTYELQQEISMDSFKHDIKIKGIVLTIAVFLLSIFLAFSLNLISQIRNDEGSMKKIHKALNKE